MARLSSDSKQLIVVALPDDPYYEKSLSDIADFARQMGEKTEGLDDFLVVYSRALDKRYKKASQHNGLPFGERTLRLVVEESLDLWVRDYGLVLPGRQIKFTYEPKYLKSKDAKYVDSVFSKLLAKLGISVQKSDIILDGGNVVDNNSNKAIISERILAENKGKSRMDLKRELENLLRSKVALVPDDPTDTTGHSDGLVSFLEDDVLLIGDYQDSRQYNAVETAIKSEFPDLKTVSLPCGIPESSGKTKWKGFTSAVGCYVNILVTNNAVYVPQFNSPVYDAKALEVIKAHTSKRVVPVDTSKLSHMGGSVRCMSWQIESSHAVAQVLCKNCK